MAIGTAQFVQVKALDIDMRRERHEIAISKPDAVRSIPSDPMGEGPGPVQRPIDEEDGLVADRPLRSGPRVRQKQGLFEPFHWDGAT